MQPLSIFHIPDDSMYDICTIFGSCVVLELLFRDILVYTPHSMISRPCTRFINGDNRLLGELQRPGVQEQHMVFLGGNHTFVKVPVNPKK